jgi:hypothetical protein
LVASHATAGTIGFGSGDYWHMAGRFGWSRTVPDGSGSGLRSISRTFATWSGGPVTSGQTIGSYWSGGAAAGVGASLSGLVWFDADRDGNYAAPDSPIKGAKMMLFRMSDLDHPLALVTTTPDGKYLFKDILPGTYALALGYPSSPDGHDSVGTLLDQNGNSVTTGTGTLLAAKDMIVDIALGKSYQGKNYDFGEPICPISKRDFVTTPEPGTLALLATGGIGGGLVWVVRRRFRRPLDLRSAAPPRG